MVKSHMPLCCAFAVASLVAFASGIALADTRTVALSALADHGVRTAGLLIVTNDAEVVSPATVAAGQTGVPAGMPDPVFWLDASDTNDWTVSVDSKGYTRVETVPSKGSSTRYATVNVSAGAGDTWYGWQHNASTFYEVKKPYLVDAPGLLPGKMLDFVDPETTTGYAPRIGLVFNKVPEFEGAAPTNAIFNIGTVIAVYGSHDGRGWFLGGGRMNDGKTYEWNRATSNRNPKDGYDWTGAAIMSRDGSGASNVAQYKGVLRHDGLPTSPASVGFGHTWEVLSWTMQSASAVATGIGVGDTRPTGWERTGQQRIAEMLIFDEVLPPEMVEKIETYLNAKWFGRKLAGYGGNAELGTLRSVTPDNYSNAETGLETEVAVPEGEFLTVGKVEGGRGLKSVIRKTGGGTLAVRDTSGWGGRFELAGGTLCVPSRTIPESVDDIVTDCYFHADASQIEDIVISEENGVEYVMGWRNRAEGIFRGESVMLAPISAGCRPELRRDALGSGMHIVDFGPYARYNVEKRGRSLSFTTNAAEQAAYPSSIGVDGIVTVIAVYGARGSGGNILNQSFWNRASVSDVEAYVGWCDVDVFSAGVYDGIRGLTTSNAVVFADGVRLDSPSWFAKPGFQTLAIRHPGGGGVRSIGCDKEGVFHGGFQLAEIYVFRRRLSDSEMTDLSAYLAFKWFGAAINGYVVAGESRKAPDISALEVKAPSSFTVSDGRTVRIGSVDLAAPLSVSGGGTLEIGELKNPLGNALAATDATVKVTGPAEPATNAEPAAGPAFHLDLSDSVNFEVEEENGTNFVARVRDAAMDRQLFASTSSRRPWLDGSVVSSSLPVLNFGPFGYYGKMLAFDRPIDAVRSVYAIWAPEANGNDKYAFMFGSSDRMTRDPLRGRLYDYHCGVTANAEGRLALFSGGSTQRHISDGEIYVDGVRTNLTYAPKAGELHLVEMHHTAPAHIAALATDRKVGDPGRNGGSMFGETLIYTRVLSEREKTATRNYLMKKWFGKTDAELAPLPDRPETDMRKLAGEGTFVKSGENTFVVGDLSSFTGTLAVADGTLRVSRPLPAAEPSLVTDGLVFHVDANKGIELVEGTENSVSRWNSVLGDGWSAVSANTYLETPVNNLYPELMTGMHDGTPFVRMLHNKGHYMVFCKDGVRSRIKNIKTVFWVIGTDDGNGGPLGGGFLLGGGYAANPDANESRWDWHRGGSNAGAYKGRFDEAIVCGSATAAVHGGDWYMDGSEVNAAETGLGSNKWHYVTAVPNPNSTYAATADGFAFDGRWLDGDDKLAHRAGGQSLAEVLIYNRTLDDAERKAVEAYLSCKWGFTQIAVTNSVDLELSAGAVLDCGGYRQYFASVSGSGTIEGDVSACTLVADAASNGLVVDGVYAIRPGTRVELAGFASWDGESDIPVLTASEYEGTEALSSAVFVGETPPAGFVPRLCIRSGRLVVRNAALGTRIILR